MKRTGSASVRNIRPGGEDGFTLTELVAGLLVASMLIVGLADITRRYAQTTARVKEITADVRATQILQTLMTDLERADPDSLDLSADKLSARMGAGQIEAELKSTGSGGMLVEWTSPRIARSVRLPGPARFEATASGAVLLRTTSDGSLLAIAHPRRSAPFDCKFDTVMRECR